VRVFLGFSVRHESPSCPDYPIAPSTPSSPSKLTAAFLEIPQSFLKSK
jgi:hypothetical protein